MINIPNKVKVFISSKCDNAEEIKAGKNKYGIMRKALKLLLEETGLCIVYAFEEGTASSFNVVNSYMDPLADSDLVIVIVDNEDGITNATMTEIGRVKAMNKKSIYVFCDERKKDITELQAELQSSVTNPRFAIVHEFSDIAQETYSAVINDVMNIYLSYCRGRLNFGEDKQGDSANKLENNMSIEIADNTYVTKEFISGFSYSKYIVKKEADMAFGTSSASEEYDENCAQLLQVVLEIGKKLPEFEIIKANIKVLFKGNIQKLVLLRYEAIECYFSGKMTECIEKLSECIEFCDTCKNIPKWMKNDVAIDLRNMQLEIDREKDIICFNSAGQQILDGDKEPLYYPVLDRIVSDYRESIVNYQRRSFTQSPYTVNLGGIDCVIEKACDSFIVAYCYGSITQMLMLKNRLYEYLSVVSFEIRNHKTFLFCVKLLILIGEDKKLKQFLHVYGENTNNINNQDVLYLLENIDVLPTQARRMFARQQVMKYFGYYYSDEIFDKELSEIVNGVKHNVIKKYATSLVVKPILEIFEENSYRVANEVVLDFVYFIFDNGCSRYYDDVFRVLKSFKVENLSEKEQSRYQEFLIEQIRDKNVREHCKFLLSAAQTLRQRQTIEHDLLDKCICDECPDFYKNVYLLNTTEHGEIGGWKYIKKYIDTINKDNDTQGKNGAYSGKAYNPYRTIANIIWSDSLSLSSSQIKSILNSLQGTLISNTQTIESKIDALELMCVIQLLHPNNRQIKKMVSELKLRWDRVIDAQDVFFVKGYSKANIEVNFSLLKCCIGNIEEMELGLMFIDIQRCATPEQITLLRTLEFLIELGLLNRIKFEEENVIFQFVLSMSYSEDIDVRFYAMSLLVKLINGNHRSLCLNRLVEIMDNEAYKGKVGLLYRLKKANLDDAKVEYIFEKGKNDSHYWVRKVAELVFM